MRSNVKRTFGKPAHLRSHILNEHGWMLGDVSDEKLAAHHEEMHSERPKNPPYGFGAANHTHQEG